MRIQKLNLKDDFLEETEMLKRYANCPVCSEKTVLDIPPDILKGIKQFPYTVKVVHEKHHFYVNLDSKGHITDILHPEYVE